MKIDILKNGLPSEFLEVLKSLAYDVEPKEDEKSESSRETAALADVLKERKKQIEKYGFDAIHDSEDVIFNKSNVGALYAIAANNEINYDLFEKLWPYNWNVQYWRPEKTARENLVKAAALILAEIESIDNNARLDATHTAPAIPEYPDIMYDGPSQKSPTKTILEDFWYPKYQNRDFLQELRTKNIDRAKLWGGNLDAQDLFRGLELAEEAGEVAGAIKKLHRADNGVVGNKKNRDEIFENLKEEIGDVMICLDRVAAFYGIDIEEVARKKFNQKSAEVGIDIFL